MNIKDIIISTKLNDKASIATNIKAVLIKLGIASDGDAVSVSSKEREFSNGIATEYKFYFNGCLVMELLSRSLDDNTITLDNLKLSIYKFIEHITNISKYKATQIGKTIFE